MTNKDELSRIEYDLLQLPSIKDSTVEMKAALDNFLSDKNVISLELLYRGISPKPFGSVGNAGARIFLKNYFPILKAAYEDILRVKEKYEELDCLSGNSKS